MELRHIRYFLAVAEEAHFTRAAARLGIGQPPLSQQIKDLEGEIGVQLFRRVPHGAELTDAGHAFLAGVRDMPGEAVAAVRAAQRAARGETGSIRVGFTGSAAFNPRVPAAIRRFRRLYPEVTLSLREADSNGLVRALRDGSLDAAVLRPDAIAHDGLAIHPLEEEAMIAAVPSAHPAAGPADAIALAALCDAPFILTPRALGPSLFDIAVGACRAAGFEPVLGQSAPQIASVLALVAAELGVTLVPASMRQAAIAGIRYLDLTDVRPVATLALAHRRGDPSAALAHFTAQARFDHD